MSRGWLLLLRRHGAGPCLLGAVVHGLTLALVSRQAVSAGIVSPSTTIEVPFASVLPAVAVLAFVPVVGRPMAAEPMAVRRLAAYRWGILAALVAIATGLLLLAGVAAGNPAEGFMAARNLIGFLGLALALRPWLGEASWIAPALFASTELVFGGSAYQSPRRWAWTMHEALSSDAAFVTVALAAAGAAMLLRSWSGNRLRP